MDGQLFLEYIIAKADIVQRANGWVAKGSDVILIGNIGTTDFNNRAVFRKLIANLCIQCTERRYIALFEICFGKEFILPPVLDIKSKTLLITETTVA